MRSGQSTGELESWGFCGLETRRLGAPACEFVGQDFVPDDARGGLHGFDFWLRALVGGVSLGGAAGRGECVPERELGSDVAGSGSLGLLGF